MRVTDWLPWPDATVGQAVRNRAVIMVFCESCRRDQVPCLPHELARKFPDDRRVDSIMGRCRQCGGRAPLGAWFPEGWVEQQNAWERRQAEGL